MPKVPTGLVEAYTSPDYCDKSAIDPRRRDDRPASRARRRAGIVRACGGHQQAEVSAATSWAEYDSACSTSVQGGLWDRGKEKLNM
jgi:hypothetical protein